MSEYLMISDAAKEIKVETHVLRYWEEELHLPIKRNELGHRYYTREDVQRFKEIKEMKEKGLQLKAIKMILKNGQLEMLSSMKQEEIEQNEKEQQRGDKQVEDGMKLASDRDSESCVNRTMPIEIIDTNRSEIITDGKEEKAKRLQWMLQQLIRETLQENNYELCQQMKESIIKEMDYQFRIQEEREEERERVFRQRNEEYYKKMDELLRTKQGKKKRHFI